MNVLNFINTCTKLFSKTLYRWIEVCMLVHSF